ncbi:MAG: hypothetical protein AAFX93_08165 [Verrucomicrobiota bacterium]
MRLFITFIAVLLSVSLRAEFGVAVVDSIGGDVSVSGSANQLKANQVINPQGIDIKTGSSGFAAFVFSNGVAVYLGPNSHLRLDSYEQIPFESEPDNLEFEPSRSRLSLQLTTGVVGIAHKEPNPVSELSIELGPGYIVKLSSQAAVIISGIEGATTALLDGRARITHQNVEHLLREGYRFNAKANLPAGPDMLETLRSDEQEALDPIVQNAIVARDRWFFETGDGVTLKPVRISEMLPQKNRRFNNTKL